MYSSASPPNRDRNPGVLLRPHPRKNTRVSHMSQLPLLSMMVSPPRRYAAEPETALGASDDL